MAVIIKNFEIINSGTSIAIDVETGVGFNITSMLLWKMDDFKDYTLTINLTDRLEQINNKEVLVIDAEDLQVSSFEDIWFIEIESDEEESECSTCGVPALGITYTLTSYYQCLLNYFLSSGTTECSTCNEGYNSEIVITINLLINMVEKSIEVGYYTQAIDMIAKLKKLCSLKKCTNCRPVTCSSCSNFTQH